MIDFSPISMIRTSVIPWNSLWPAYVVTLQWRHNGRDGVSNHRRLECLLNRLFRHRSKKTLKLRVTGLGEGNPPVTGGFRSQRASNAENVFIWWRHHELGKVYLCCVLLLLGIRGRGWLTETCACSSFLATRHLTLRVGHISARERHHWLIIKQSY